MMLWQLTLPSKQSRGVKMDVSLFINEMRDPAGVPFYPVVFQGLYVLTWALHALFVYLAIGAMGVSIYGGLKQKGDAQWKQITSHLLMTGKIAVSVLIVLGVAPLLFSQTIYDAGWYVTNALSGAWVFTFIYALVFGYMMYYWYQAANKKGATSSTLIGVISFVFLVFCGVLMHNFSYESISPDKWMEWYAPDGVVDNSGWNFHVDTVRLLFMGAMTLPVVGVFMQVYAKFLSSRSDFSAEYLSFVAVVGKKIALIGFSVATLLFMAWMYKAGYVVHPLTVGAVVLYILSAYVSIGDKNAYVTATLLVVAILVVSAIRELIRYDIMSKVGYDLYGYPLNIDWSSTVLFILTFGVLGLTGFAFILAMAWKVGKSEGVFDGQKDVLVSKLANYSLMLFSAWIVAFFGWGMITLFKNTL